MKVLSQLLKNSNGVKRGMGQRDHITTLLSLTAVPVLMGTHAEWAEIITDASRIVAVGRVRFVKSVFFLLGLNGTAAWITSRVERVHLEARVGCLANKHRVTFLLWRNGKAAQVTIICICKYTQHTYISYTKKFTWTMKIDLTFRHFRDMIMKNDIDLQLDKGNGKQK